MFDLIDIILDSTFEAVYICCWFSFLGTIFYKVYVEPLQHKQLLLYSSMCKIRNILAIDDDSNEKITKQLIDIQSRLQKLIKIMDESNSTIKEETHELPPQNHIIFPHFMIYPAKSQNYKESYLLSCNLSKFLDLKLGTTYLNLDDIKNIFINHIIRNNLVKDNELIMKPNIEELFGITDNTYKLKLSECEHYLRPHLKNKHR